MTTKSNTITFNSFYGGISDHYHTGNSGQFAESENIDSSTHKDAIMLENSIDMEIETTGAITCGLDLSEYFSEEKGFVFATADGKIYYKNEVICDEWVRKYLACFYDVYTEDDEEKKGVFFVHTKGVDRYEYDDENDTFTTYKRYEYSKEISDTSIQSVALVQNNANIYIGYGNIVLQWDGVLFSKRCEFPEISKIVGLTAYGDNIHIYASDGYRSYKYIWNPIEDEDVPGSLREWKGRNILGVSSMSDVDVLVSEGDNIYQSSGLQVQILNGYRKNTITDDRNYNGCVATRENDIFFGTNTGDIFALIQPYIGSYTQLVKWKSPGEDISFLFGGKDALFVGYKKGEKYFLGKKKWRSGDNPASQGSIVSHFYSVPRVAQISKLLVFANLRKEYQGQIDIFARKNITDQWTHLASLDEGLDDSVFIFDKIRLIDDLSDWHEIQFKVLLTRSNDGKSPLFYGLYLDYENSMNG